MTASFHHANQNEEMSSISSCVPVGYIIRPPVEENIAALIELMYTCDLTSTGEAARYSPDDVRGDWDNLDPTTDAWCIFSSTGELAAYGLFWSHDAIEYSRLWSDGYVHPQHEGRGLGAALLDLIEKRAAEVALHQPTNTRLVLVNNILADNVSARLLFEAHNYSLTRVFFTMRIVLDAEPATPDWPQGISIRTCDGSVEDMRRAYEVIEEGFRDHFEHTPRTFEEWQQYMVREDFDPALWFLALDDEQVVGAALCRVRDPEVGLGWINQLAVLAPWRKRGLGRALLHYAFGAFYLHGLKTAGLGVDGESLTGAQRLYERAGMHVIMRIGRYEKELLAGRELHPGRTS